MKLIEKELSPEKIRSLLRPTSIQVQKPTGAIYAIARGYFEKPSTYPICRQDETDCSYDYNETIDEEQFLHLEAFGGGNEFFASRLKTNVEMQMNVIKPPSCELSTRPVTKHQRRVGSISEKTSEQDLNNLVSGDRVLSLSQESMLLVHK